MILVDTSVWIDHLRRPDPVMLHLLQDNFVVMHPLVLGEIALGTMKNWHGILAELGAIPFAPRATDNEVISLIDGQKLRGTGIGFIDAHLLASTLLRKHNFLWTKDRRLAAIADRLGVDATTS